jgi:hypothetical protein
MNLAQQIQYAGQVKRSLAGTLEDPTGMDFVIESLRTLKSSCGGSNNDSYIVEMKPDDYRALQEYKRFKTFTESEAITKQRRADAAQQSMIRRLPALKIRRFVV